MGDRESWPWWETMAGRRPDPSRLVRVDRIAAGTVRDRCASIGLTEGQELRLRERTPDDVKVELSDGAVRSLELPVAWFVRVLPVPDAHAGTSSAGPAT